MPSIRRNHSTPTISRATTGTLPTQEETHESVVQEPKVDHNAPQVDHNGKTLPRYNHMGHKVMRGLHPDGESGRKGFHPLHFFKIVFKSNSTPSMLANVFWPAFPIAIALHFARPEWHLGIFISCYIAMVPAANLLGFAGEELSRKIPKKNFAMLLETTFGSVVEIVLFMVLLKKSHQRNSNVDVIKAAILGSILANLLFALGACFIVGGLKNHTQKFHEAVSEAGSGLMMVAGMALVLPAVYSNYLVNNSNFNANLPLITERTTTISRGVAIISIIGYIIYIYFQMVSHDSLLHDIFEEDEAHDNDRQRELMKPKLTLTECVLAITFSIASVALIAIFLVIEIPYMVEERGISDAFMGLILVPFVEKFSEHLLAIDEAWDNQMNMALAHVLGASIQTALFNAPLVVLVGWGVGIDMDYNFALFDAVALILAIITVGNFLRDGESDYLEGSLCIMMYIIITICAFYFPNPAESGSQSSNITNPTGDTAARF